MENNLILELVKLALNNNNQENQVQAQESTTSLIGQYVIIRTYSAGVWAGYLKEKVKKEVYLTEARRMYKWVNIEGISLSGIALNGLNKDESNICAPVGIVWLEAIEIIPCTENAKQSIINQPIYK